MKNTPKIVIATPTGHVGSRVVPLLIQAGAHPTLLIRDPSHLAVEIHSVSDIHQGDLFDEKFVLESTKNADALFWVIPENPQSGDPMGDVLELGRIGAEAVAKNEIHRVVFLSSGGAETQNETFIGSLGKVEEMFNATGANALHLRAGMMFTNLLANVEELKQGALSTTIPLDLKIGWNDPRDLGDIVAARLLSPEWAGQLVQYVHGPAELSFHDVAGILSEALDREIRAVKIADEDLRQSLLASGTSEAHAHATIAMLRSVGAGEFTAVKQSYTSTTPTALGAWAYSNLRPLVKRA